MTQWSCFKLVNYHQRIYFTQIKLVDSVLWRYIRRCSVFIGGSTGTSATPAGRQVMFLGHILIDLTVQISCFLLRQNAPLSNLGLKFLSSSNFKNIGIRMHRLASLISKCSQQFWLFLKKKFRGGGSTTTRPFTYFKLTFLPLVTDFARMHPRQLKLPIYLTATTKVYSMSLYD